MVRDAAPHYQELIDRPDQLVGERVMRRSYRAGDGPAFVAAVAST